jgi:hypothetical protein
MFLKINLEMQFFCFICFFVLIGLPIKSLYACNPDEEVEELSNALKKKIKVSNPVTLSRVCNGSLTVSYTQQLASQGKELNLDRKSTRKAIQYVCDASAQDNFVTHLLAQGFCKGANSRWNDPFITNLRFPGIMENSNKKIDYVSNDSKAESNEICYIRKPQTPYWGGHAEPQLISDLKALFTQNSDAVVKLFTPPSKNTENVYMCGLEIFGPYDMCDKYNNEGQNKYDCVGQLLKFRTDHQEGQQSISKAIRHKLGNRFKGNKEDAFVVIYHAHSPYSNIDSYRAESEEYYHHLRFEFDGYSFLRKKNNFDNSYSLSQIESVDIKPNILYGYIHHLGNRKAIYDPNSQRFSFP